MAEPAPSIADVTAALTAPGQLFEMEEVVIEGRPTRTWKNAPPSLRAVLESSRAHGAADLLVYEDDHLSFEAHFRAAATLAHRLVDDYGVRPGDRVAIAMRNFPEWSIAFWAAASINAVVVPLNAWWTGPELEYGLADSGSVVLFCDGERAERLAGHLPGLDAVRATIVAKPEPGGALPAAAVTFEEAIGEVDAAAELPDVAIDPEDDATIFYTSGTTGRPKGALGTQRNICTNLLSLVYAQARGAARARPAGEPPPPAPGPERLPAVGAVLPRHGLPLDPRAQRGLRREDRHHAQVGRRPGAGADRAGAGDDVRRRPGHGLAGPGASRLRHQGHLVGAVDRVRRRARLRPSWCAASRRCSPAGRRATATG